MKLSKYTVKHLAAEVVTVPQDWLFDLPEKVLQFGTGVLLRGLPDYFIDKANKQGIFNGRVVVIKSTQHGDTTAFDKQDGLYTHIIRAVENGRDVQETIVNSSISRVLSAADQWEQILECAHDRNMQVIISNTTEVGIQLINDNIRHHPPTSFPGKLLAFLYERFTAFGGSEQSGMVIVPTELIPDNGSKLQSIVLELAHLNGLEDAFIEWLEKHNTFCNSLVDRIVPGKPDAITRQQIETETGYTDQLMIVSESYGLWAIEGGEKVKNILSFADADDGVIIAEDIEMYRELKLRLLNGTHTLSCGIAYLSGCTTVKNAMEDECLSQYIHDLMLHEIAPSIPYQLEPVVAEQFGTRVLDRFRNPYLQHQWLSITMNYSSKMKMRCVPLLKQHYRQSEAVPELMAAGFAAYLLFMKPVEVRNGKYYGISHGTEYLIDDEQAEVFSMRWNRHNPSALVKDVLSDINYWGHDLHALPNFAAVVTDKLQTMMQLGARETLERIVYKGAVI